METLPFFAFGPPSGFHSGLIFRMTHGPSSVICPLGVRVWFFTMFHVPVVELYFPIMAWFDIKGIFKLIKFSLYGVFQFFMFPLSNPPPHNGMGLEFDVRSFERFPFGFSLAVLYLLILFIFRWEVQLVFHLPFDHLIRDPFDVITWHLFLLFL
jgi:hypothetical protein